MPRGRFGRVCALVFGLAGAASASMALAGTVLASTTTGQAADGGGVELVAAGVGAAIGAAWLLKPAGWRLHRRGRGSRGARYRVR